MRVDLLLVFISLSLSSSPSNPTPHGLSPLIPLCGLFLLRTSAIQASLIALGLASVLLSPFSFLLSPPGLSPFPYASRSLSPTNECVARR